MPCTGYIPGRNATDIPLSALAQKRQNALSYVPGSHLGSAVLNMFDFGLFNADGKADVDRVNFTAIAEADVPDIDADPERYGVVAWDMEPGDAVFFDGRGTAHF